MQESEVLQQERFIAAVREKVLGNNEEASRRLEELAGDAPKNAPIHFEWATVLYSLKQKEKSLLQAKEAYGLDPENKVFGQFYAERLDDKADYKGAALVYQNLSKTFPNDKDMYMQQGLMSVKAGDTENALKAFNTLETKLGLNEETTRRKFLLFVALGQQEKAANEWLRLIEKFPNTVEYRHELANFYTTTGSSAKAMEVYQAIQKIAPSDPQAMFALTKDAGKKGDEVAFLQSLRGMFARTDITVDNKIKQLAPYLDLMTPQTEPRLAAEVLSCARSLADTHPKDAQAQSFYADLLYKNGQKEAALPVFLRSAEADKKRFYPWQFILIILTETKNFDELLKQSDRAMDYFPNQPLVYYMSGVGLYQKEKYKAAADMFTTAVPMLGANSTMRQDVQHQLGRSYTQLKQYDLAENAFANALANGGNKDAGVLEHYGDLQFLQGRTDAAMQNWQKAQTAGNKSDALRKKISDKRIE